MFTLLNIKTVFGLATIASLVLSLPQTTTPPTTTTTTTAQHIPNDACVVDGKIYQNGAKISGDAEHCAGSICSHGTEMSWDHKCSFGQPRCPNGHLVDIPGQCCHECIEDITTVPPSAIVG